MNDQETLEKGQHQMLSWIKYMNIGLVISILSAFAYGVKKDSLTFDSQEQKQEVISRYSERLNEHTQNELIHMSFEEKSRLIILEQTQKKILENQSKTMDILENVGGDLQEIKNLVRKN